MPKLPRKTLTVTLTRPIAPSVSAALDALHEEFPAAFRQPPQPLPEGILQTVHEHLAGQHSKKAVRRALALWCNRGDYLRAVAAEDAHLIALDGSDAGLVPEEQREAALKRLADKGLSATPQPPAARPSRPARTERRPPLLDEPAENGARSGPTIIKKKTQIRHRLRPSTTGAGHHGNTGQRPTLSLRKRTSDKDS